MSEGQVFPVQSTVQLNPPYSLYLSDYAAPGSERLRVTAFLIDATRPELNVRFRLRIEGNGIKIETKPEFLPPPVTLLGGVPLQLISSDLAAYFDPRNLNFTGITQREIEQRGALPEGLYQFCFEVIEYNRGVKISNTGCAVAWLILNDPPIVNLPRDNEKIRIQDPQQVVFQWTPRHRGSPNSAFNAEYDFKLVEVWPSTRNPNDAILTSPVIFQTTTSETTLIYGPAETPLEPGRRYAFQIRARAYAGADEVSLFKNNGFSQVYTFVYGDACLVPQNIVTSDIGITRFSVNFDATSNQTNYTLRYRLSPVALAKGDLSSSAKGDLSSSAKEAPLSSAKATESAWYTTTSLTPNLTINSLQPNTRYEFQVNAGCGTFTSDYSLLTSVTTKDNPGIQYSCGVPLTPFNLDPSQLINSLRIGDVIKAGDFDVILSKVSGSNGTFSGEGVIEVSYFNRAKVKAEFTNINVSNEMRMVNGYMNVTGAGVEVIPAGVMDLMDDLDEALAKADELLGNRNTDQFDENATVTSTLITVPGTAIISQGVNGSVVIVDASGKRTELPKGTTASVVDGTGKGYIIDSKGKVHSTTAAVATKAANREYNLKLKFAASAEQKFGFDEKRYDQIASTYTKIENQYLSWKSVATGQTDKVIASLEGSGIDKSKIRFELNGAAVNSQWSSVNGSSPMTNDQSTNDQKNDQSTIDIRGTGDGIEEELIASYPGEKKDQVFGKLSVVTYDQIVKDLVIVPVNGNKYPYDEVALRTQLNKIYGQAVVKWNITFASNFDVPGIDPFDDGGSGLLSNYSPAMRKVVNAYKANVQRNTYYLFLVKNPKSTTLAGFMPRSKRVGFIFLDKNGSEEELARTIAHELGHGAFQLRHTFADEKNTLTEGTTDNLMDYTLSGTKLYKYQWDRVRYREIVIGLFEGDEEGAMTTVALETYVKSFSLDESYYAVEGGLLPEYLWKSGLINPYAAGFVDGLWETIEGTWGIAKFLVAWQPNNFSGEAMIIRMQTYQFAEFLNELAKSPELRTQAWNNLKQSFSEYIDETVALDNQAMYNQGKLIFDVVTLFIGVGEIKAILTGQKVTIGIVALLNAVPKNLSKFVFKLKNFGLKIVKSGNDLSIIGKQGGEVAALVKSGDGSILQVTENGWVDEDLANALDELTPSGSFVVEAKGGVSGSKWNMILNRALRPNAIYRVDQYIFDSDNLGRVKKVSGELKLQTRGRNTYQQGRSVEIKDGIDGDQGGHLIADIFYGPGEQINYLPMKSTLNQSAWRQMENTLKKALEEGKKVDIEIRPVFEGNSKRPVAFEVDHWISGEKTQRIFTN